jgi:aquaporin Z
MADASAPAPYTLLSRLLAELFGTFLLVFGVIGAALFLSASSGPLGIALAVGLAVLTAGYAVGHISGGHFNPAVTIGAAAAGRMPWRDVLPYMAAQVVGGVLATLGLGLFAVVSPSIRSLDFAAVSNGYGVASPSGFSLAGVLIAEVVATALFLYIILGVTAPGEAHSTAGFAPLAIGLALTLVHLVMIPVDNSSVNPARSIATAVLGGATPIVQLWLFIVAPLLGGLIAGFTWRFLFAGRRQRVE